jgi:hypothetical protein
VLIKVFIFISIREVIHGFLANNITKYIGNLPIPLTARSKAWVCGRSLARIASSNPAEGMDVCVL